MSPSSDYLACAVVAGAFLAASMAWLALGFLIARLLIGGDGPLPSLVARVPSEAVDTADWIGEATRELDTLAYEFAGTQYGEEIEALARRGRELLGEAGGGGEVSPRHESTSEDGGEVSP